MCGQLMLSLINVEIGIRFDCYTRMPYGSLENPIYVNMVKDRIASTLEMRRQFLYANYGLETVSFTPIYLH